MIASDAVKERVQIPLATEVLDTERIAYLEGLVSQAKTAAAVFTQFTQEDVDRIVKADGPGRTGAGSVSRPPGGRRNQARRDGRQGHQEHGGHASSSTTTSRTNERSA